MSASGEAVVEPIVTVAQGQLRGVEHDGVVAFKGIPYAAAPFGAHRLREPAPATAWHAVRSAAEYGPTPPAPPWPSPFDELTADPVIAGEECLNLNVWAPALDDRIHPVMVWIHGGSFTNGNGAVSTYDGTRFARDGIVCVTINYRLGAEGFLLIEGAPANRGILDQIAALRWIRDNIWAFGGDPDAATIAGESAGAMSVTTLMTLPSAAGLFTRAIAQSGAGHHVLTKATASKVTAALASSLGIEATMEGFLSVPVDVLLAQQDALTSAILEAPDPAVWGEIAGDLMPFEPVLDGTVITALPIDRLKEGAGRDVDVLIGTTADEEALFLVPNGFSATVDEQMLASVISGLHSEPDVVIAAYRETRPQATPGELLIAALTDWNCRIPAVRVAEARLAQGADTYVYEFCWRSPQFEGKLGACHFLEVGFVFDNLDDPIGEPLTGAAPPQQVADEMHRAWVQFVNTGDPGWAPYATHRTVHQFNLQSATVNDPQSAQRQLWDGLR